MGYNAVLWEVEDKIRWETCPECVYHDAFTKDEFREILAEADRLGLEPIPLMQTFAHAEYILSHERYRSWREADGNPTCYCVSRPEVRAFQKRFLREYLELFGRKVRYFHLGADEAHAFGTCPQCSKRDRFELFVEHLEGLAAVLLERGIRPGIWCDMMLTGKLDDEQLDAQVRKFPRYLIAWYWDYYYGNNEVNQTYWANRLGHLTKNGFPVIFAPATASCGDGPFLPMYGRHSKNVSAAAELARRENLLGLCVTSWSVHLSPKCLQYPLWELAARRYLNPADSVGKDMADILHRRIGPVDAQTMVDLTSWNPALTPFDSRFGIYAAKWARPAFVGTAKNAVAARRRDAPGYVPPTRREIEEALDPPKKALDRLLALPSNKRLEPFVMGAKLAIRHAEIIADELDGLMPLSLPEDESCRFFELEQGVSSAARSSSLVWSTLSGSVPTDPDTASKIGELESRTGLLPRDPEERVVDAPLGMKLILLIGQSNMAGRADMTEEDRRPIDQAFMLNRDDKWVAARAPFHYDRETAGLSPANQFVKRYLSDHPNEIVGIVPCAVGGSRLATWYAEGDGPVGENFRRALARVKTARINGDFVAILWHQGETDAGLPGVTEKSLARYYPQRFKEMADAFRRTMGNAEIPLVVGEIGRFMTNECARINPILNRLPQMVGHTSCVSSEGLTNRDQYHFDAPSARELGDRYYSAFLMLSKDVSSGDFIAQPGFFDDAVLHGETDRERIVDYSPGEEIAFSLSLQGAKPFPSGKYFVNWSRTGDDGKKVSGRIDAAHLPFVIKTTLASPGFVRVEACIVDDRGEPCKRRFTGDASTPEGKEALNAFERGDKRIFFDGGAGVQINSLQTVPEPEDFDSFWSARKARLGRVPLKAVVENRQSADPSVRVMTFTVACAGPRPATGWVTVPTDATKKYPARISFHGYGSHFVQWIPDSGPRDEIQMFINAHGYELGREDEYYTEFYNSIKSNGHTFGMDSTWQNNSTDTAYFGWMVYRIMRALQYLKSFPEWNGRDIVASGGSMGGLQAIWAASVDSDVSRVEAWVPWCCDVGGRETMKRNFSGWGVGETEALRYFDPVNLAKRISPKCHVEITRAGLGDYCCPPCGIAILYNNLKCPKKINWVQGSTHGYVPTEAHQHFSLSSDWE